MRGGLLRVAQPPLGGQATLLHVDAELVAVAKPPGLSLATPRRQPGAAVARLLGALPSGEAERWGLTPADTFLLHRLDVGTSGVVLLARGDEAQRRLLRRWQAGEVEKVYLALVWGRPRPREGSWRWAIGPDRGDRRRVRVDPGGKAAHTDYRVLATAPHVALVRLLPRTGRTHQLRVHLAHAGHPIVGDLLYGGPRHRGVRDPKVRRALAAPHPLLHAWRLALPAEGGRPPLTVTAPLPPALEEALRACGLASEWVE